MNNKNNNNNNNSYGLSSGKLHNLIADSRKYDRKKGIAILIPAYNEAKYIKDVLTNCLKYKMDLIIVDDGSIDNTVKIVSQMSSKPHNSKIILIEHEKNLGKGQALITGFDYVIRCGYKGVITLDADGQHDSNEIKFFLDTIRERDPDIIIGNRLGDTRKMPFIRLATNVFTSWIISRIAGKKISDVQSGFRYLKNEVLREVRLETKNFDTEPEIIIKASWLNFNIINIPIKTIYHQDFISYVNPVKDTIKFFKLVFRSIIWKRRFRKTGN